MARPSLVAAASLLSCIFAGVAADNDYITAGDSGVSAQQMFLGTEKTVYIVDKTENNPMQVAGHPAWATQWSLQSQTSRPMDVVTNSFCAGGISLGNGTWLNVGGNQAIQKYGLPATPGSAPYHDIDGGLAVRLLDPCDDASCQWADNPANYMTTRRWYPTLETLEDGQAMIIGGELYGGFVCDPNQHQNNPTYEIFPSARTPVRLQFLDDSMPLNLYPLTWLLPSGNIFLQANYLTEVFDYKAVVEHRLPDMPHAARTYPASAATAMLPLTPANNWTATVLFCGGSDLQSNDWNNNVTFYQDRPNSASCVHMSPDTNPTWVENDDQPQGRSMGQFIILPDQRLFLTNGIATGVAGYTQTGDDSGIPYGRNPVFSGAYFNSTAPAGQRWSTQGIGNLTYPRMYHSSATLLPDGSVFISGSNPYPDFITQNTPGKEFWTETRNEIFRPDYFSKPRPTYTGMPTSLSYGGQYFNLSLPASSISSVSSASQVKVVAIKTGFSTHAMNMGQRLVELATSMTGNPDGSATLHVSQPPSPAILQPGPTLVFVVVNGVPAQGKMVMAGSGSIGVQTVNAAQQLPTTSGVKAASLSSGSSPSTPSGGASSGKHSDAGRSASAGFSALCAVVVGAALYFSS